MVSPWKTVRVFISSTFRDMHGERDHLVKVVFPALREQLAPYRIELIDIDLRWGVTREQAESNCLLDACFQQIEDCRPFFIAILGERYGCVSTMWSSEVTSRYPWIQRETGKSITELEIIFGALSMDSRMRGRSFFYFRDPRAVDDIPQPIRSQIYIETVPDRINKLIRLKQRILSSGYPVFDAYPACWNQDEYDPPTKLYGRLVDLEVFGRRVREQLWDAIKAEYDLPDTPIAPEPEDWLVTEANAQERFMETRLRIYVGRQSLQQTLFDYADGSQTFPCLVNGPSGSGKSAGLAKFVTDYKQSHQDVLVIPHFIGASARSEGLRDLLQRLCQVLKDALAFAGNVPDDVPTLAVRLREFIVNIPRQHRVLLVLDALNQLEDTNRACDLWWLPRELPAHVKVIASFITDPQADEAKTDPAARAFRQRPYHPVQIEPLTLNERREIIRQVPALSAKMLDDEQINLLLSNPETNNPLYLRVALEELRGFGSFERLNDRIAALPHEGMASEALINAGFSVEAIGKVSNPVTGLFVQVIERLEQDFGRHLVRALLTLLATARRGLSERELLDLVEGIDVPITDSQSDLFPVIRQLRSYLQSRGGLLNFFHKNLLIAVQKYYFDNPDAQRVAHSRLADYFQGQDEWLEPNEARQERVRHTPHKPRLANKRKVDELPWQLLQAHRWNDISRLLTDLSFIEAKAEAGMVFELVQDYGEALRQLPGGHQSYRVISLLSQAIRHDLAFLIRHPTTLFQCLWNRGWWYDCRDAAGHYESLPFRWEGCASQTPWQHPGHKLSSLLESWREEKEKSFPGFTWLRSLRPLHKNLGSMLFTILNGHSQAVRCLAFSTDNQLIAAGFSGGAIQVWDLSSGNEVANFDEHCEPVNSLAFLPNSHGIVSGGGLFLRFWDVEQREELKQFKHDTSSVSAIAVSPVGDEMATGYGNGEIYLFSLAEPSVLSALHCHSRIRALAFSPDGGCIAFATGDSEVYVWDKRNDHKRLELNEKDTGSAGRVQYVSFSDDGTRIAAGFSSGYVWVWLTSSKALLDRIYITTQTDSFTSGLGPPERGNCSAISSDLKYHAYPTRNEIFLGDLTHYSEKFNSPLLINLLGHRNPVTALGFSSGGAYLASGARDGEVYVWDLRAEHTALYPKDHKRNSSIVKIYYSPKYVASFSSGSEPLGDENSLLFYRKDGKPVSDILYRIQGLPIYVIYLGLPLFIVVRLIWDVYTWISSPFSLGALFESLRATVVLAFVLLFGSALFLGLWLFVIIRILNLIILKVLSCFFRDTDAGSRPEYEPLCVIDSGNSEITVRSREEGRVIAWLPSEFTGAVRFVGDRTWAVPEGHHLCIFKLEGDY